MNWVEKLQQHHVQVFKKYAQCFEEAYLEDILYHVRSIKSDINILEFGAWDGYHLSNTRHFIEKGYKALLIDGDNHGNEEVKKHFITRENVLEILSSYNMPPRFDLFCIDLDGNDIYILEQVLSQYMPSVIIAEFNPIWAATESRAIAYDPEHTWSDDDYYGFSFAAGLKMANKFGYTCVFQNDNLNMYFVKNSMLAESLNIDESEIPKIVPVPSYTVTYGHKKSEKNNWVTY